MKRLPRVQYWPSLEYRAAKMADQARHERLAALAKAAEDEFVEHLRTCPDCRKKVATMVRSGQKLSQRILEAAKIDVLN